LLGYSREDPEPLMQGTLRMVAGARNPLNLELSWTAA
jgi:hypothetical protein